MMKKKRGRPRKTPPKNKKQKSSDTMTSKRGLTEVTTTSEKKSSEEEFFSKLESLLAAGCSGIQAAAYLRVDPGTLYNRVERKNKKSFTDYRNIQQARGQAAILHKQFTEALRGNNAMMIWTGKNMLGQSDSPSQQFSFDARLSGLLDALKKVKGKEDFGKEITTTTETNEQEISSDTGGNEKVS